MRRSSGRAVLGGACCSLLLACVAEPTLETDSATLGAAGEALSLTVFPASVDRVSPGDEGVWADGEDDGVFVLVVTGPVAGVRLGVTDASGTPLDGVQWDTWGGDHALPAGLGAGFTTGAETWVLGVEDAGLLLNRREAPYAGELAAPLSTGVLHVLSLYAPYAGWFEGFRFRADVVYTDGTRSSAITPLAELSPGRIDRIQPGDQGVTPDRVADAVVDVTITGRVADVRLVSLDAAGEVVPGVQWDTIVGNRALPELFRDTGFTRGAETWLVGVEENGRMLNATRGQSRGSLAASLGPGAHALRLYAPLPYAGFFDDAGTSLRVDVVLTDGTVTSATTALDECALGTSSCAATAICNDTFLGHSCSCPDGRGDGLSCLVCGNGLVQDGELCDDGVNDGSCGSCNADCSGWAPCAALDVGPGGQHSCVLRDDGTIGCWGFDELHQAEAPEGVFTALGVGTNHACALDAQGHVTCWGDATEGRTAAPAGTFVSVAVGQDTSCALAADGTPSCWGVNDFGQATPPAGVRFSSISPGGLHSCGIALDGQARCWGYDAFGQSTVPAGVTLRAISANGFDTCGIRADGTLLCWGWENAGVRQAPAGSFTSVSVGDEHACALRDDGAAVCWGFDPDGRATAPSGGFTLVRAGLDHSCGLRADRSVECWGDDSAGQSTPPARNVAVVSAGGIFSWPFDGFGCSLGNDFRVDCWGVDAFDPDAPEGLELWSLSVGQLHACGVALDGTARCWGRDFAGRPFASPPPGTFVQVASGGTHTCGLRQEGNVECWGSNSFGESSPPAGTFQQVDAGSGQSCGLAMDGTVQCWGDLASPEGTFLWIAVGGFHACGLRPDRTIACWGENWDGQTEPPPGQWANLASGLRHSCALGFDGEAVCWGDDDYGQSRPPAGPFAQIDAGWDHTCAVRTDGTEQCWGRVVR